MIRVILIAIAWLVFMVSSFDNPARLLIAWCLLPFAFLACVSILEKKNV